ncbi:MAG: tetratricopeptide repeat protein, partial [Anaerolineales bacterium]|nr:tetratricopeptide repeat protein [Anaerolineales bacterium]
YIFKHALTQETVYDSLLLKRRKEVHEKIGGAIEELYSDNLEEHASMLAYHYERAEIRDRAIHYMTRAADRAKAIYANKEAIAFYRRAIEQVSQLLREEGEPREEWPKIATQLHESLGDVLELTGQHDEARDAYESALVQISKHDPIWQARLHHKTGNVCREQRRYEEALQAYDLAETALGQEPAESAPEWWQAWIEIQSDRMWLHYWQVQLHQMTELAEMVRPAVEQYGTPAQRSRLFQGLVLIAWRRDRYVVSKETMAHARASLEAIRESGNPSGIALAQFTLGFSYLWRGDLEEAEEHLRAALKLAERIGDAVVQSRCLTYLTILYRKRMEMEEVQHYISRALTVATAGKMLEYISTAKANLAWVMWREGNLSGAQENGRTALEMWQQEPLVYPFQWTALWPLIGVALAREKVFEAVDYARALLEPSQQRLPDALIAVLEEVIKTWKGGESETAYTYLNQAIELAHELRCF